MKARAKRIDNGELVVGLLYDYGDSLAIRVTDKSLPFNAKYIDPTTIEYEVNGEWLSKEEIAERLNENARLREEVQDWQMLAEEGGDLASSILLMNDHDYSIGACEKFSKEHSEKRSEILGHDQRNQTEG